MADSGTTWTWTMVMGRRRSAILLHYHHHLLLLFTTISSFVLWPSEGLQLIQSWQTSTNTNTKGATILAITGFPIVVDIENNRNSPHKQQRQRQASVVATAGYEGGTVRLWMLPAPTATNTSTTKDSRIDHVFEKESPKETPAFQKFDLHEGSIFALLHFRTVKRSKEKKNSEQYIVSGSFDRTASLHRIVATMTHRLLPPNMIESTSMNPMTNDTTTTTDSCFEHCTIALESIASLPEHTGWVRGVQGLTFQSSMNQQSDMYLLSIGCNIINVWTIVDEKEKEQPQEKRKNVVRVARFDAGPSPGDPPSETFRRHDILCLAVVDSGSVVVDSSSSPPWIVAGLVDGTIRVFDVDVPKWSHRRQSITSPYDATGSCTRRFVETGDDIIPDDAPRLAMRAHQGRITGIHSIPDRPGEFISVGHDGRWMHWRIQVVRRSLDNNQDANSNGGGMDQDNELTLHFVAEGCVPAEKEDGDDAMRICSSVISRGTKGQDILLVGTTGGHLYEIAVSSVMDATKTSECREIWSDRTGKVKITALTSIDDCHYDGHSTAIVAGTSSGSVLVFKG
jgi:WD domain, G-beta repeat